MGANMSVARTSSIGGISFQESKSLQGDAMIVEEVSVPAANAAVLSTRSGNTSGTITCDESSHSIDEGDLVDVYWDGGCRRSMVAGVLSGADVPLTGGSGDNLPTQDTVVTAAVAQELDVGVLGTNVIAIALATQSRGQFSFQDSGGEEWAVELGAGESKTWHNEMASEDNPITGDQITKVLVSHAASTGAKTMKVGILYDND